VLPVFVINLDRSPARLATMVAQLDRLGVPFERISASDGRNLSPEDADRNPPSVGRRPLSPGEIGCFGSHRRFWSIVVERNLTAAVVLEDDVILDDRFVEALAGIAARPQASDVIRFMSLTHEPAIAVSEVGLFALEEPISFSRCIGTQGYAIGQVAAIRLLAQTLHWNRPVDDFLDRVWLHDVATFVLSPQVLRISPSVASDIATGPPATRRFRKTLAHRAARETIRCREWLHYSGWFARRSRIWIRCLLSG
jgi:glycosyl transferase family 25